MHSVHKGMVLWAWKVLAQRTALGDVSPCSIRDQLPLTASCVHTTCSCAQWSSMQMSEHTNTWLPHGGGTYVKKTPLCRVLQRHDGYYVRLKGAICERHFCSAGFKISLCSSDGVALCQFRYTINRFISALFFSSFSRLCL